MAGSSTLSISCGEAFPVVCGVFHFVDHSCGVILDADAALSLSVDDQIILPEAEITRSFAGEQLSRRGKEDPVEFLLGDQQPRIYFGLPFDSGQQRCRNLSRFDQTPARCDVQAAGSPDDEQASDTGPFRPCDDGRVSGEYLLVDIGVFPCLWPCM